MYLAKESKKQLKASSKFTNAGCLDEILQTANYGVLYSNSPLTISLKYLQQDNITISHILHIP